MKLELSQRKNWRSELFFSPFCPSNILSWFPPKKPVRVEGDQAAKIVIRPLSPLARALEEEEDLKSEEDERAVELET